MICSICDKCINEKFCREKGSSCGIHNNYGGFIEKPTDKSKGETMKEKVEVDFRVMNQDYEALDNVLMDAYEAASSGKGKERHATDNAFEDQIICTVPRMLKNHPFAAQAYQIIKKTIEAGRLYNIKGSEAAYHEMLGAVNYCAAMCILIKEKEE
jgi:hypothetical protein